jgi:serine/threonine protein kinase
MDDWSERILSSTWRWSDSIQAERLTDIKYISSGTFAVVYKATLISRNGTNEGAVALKVMKPYKAKQTSARRSFLQELAVHRLLKHK